LRTDRHINMSLVSALVEHNAMQFFAITTISWRSKKETSTDVKYKPEAWPSEAVAMTTGELTQTTSSWSCDISVLKPDITWIMQCPDCLMITVQNLKIRKIRMNRENSTLQMYMSSARIRVRH